MSYESQMMKDFQMPKLNGVEDAIIVTLFKHNGLIKEFSSNQEIVHEIADKFSLSERQRNAYLETIYRKEDRVKKSYLWHRLLFRAADILAKRKYITRPTDTYRLTGERAWMLTENGLKRAFFLLKLPVENKDLLLTKTYEVQEVINKLSKAKRPEKYDPFETKKPTISTYNTTIRKRGFRQAVIEVYDYRCAICGLKIKSPDSLMWEVQAAHIVPHSVNGKDDLWNGIALCHLHHWAFDVGWFTVLDDYTVKVSTKYRSLLSGYGNFYDFNFIRELAMHEKKIILPKTDNFYPHPNSIKWHHENVFNK